ncbi:terpene synthase-like [Cataglyphis hispanica]|uniref:terpene synthase-like n=1 Tax=Cataglyphis hispanica TaxID=1086592 RepID=UPI00217FC55E|nr:terpene synthase-like [Cataglyphis hispanica]
MTNTNENKPFYHSLSGVTQQDDKLLEPIRYILQSPGKVMDEKLFQAFNYWIKILPDKMELIREIVILFYNACVIVDDIQDNSILRRSIPVAHSIYGIANSLSSANYAFFIAMERVIDLHPAAMKMYVEQALEFHKGQGMDIFWRDNFICPNESDYEIMATRKVRGILNLIVKLMKLFSTCEQDLSSLITTLSLFFQIRDDYGNLCSNNYTENKSYCEDLTEGKFSFPIIHALTTNPNDSQIRNILKQRTASIEVKRYCVELLEKFGSFKYTRNVLEKLEMKARDEIERLGGNPYLIKILDELKNLDYWN